MNEPTNIKARMGIKYNYKFTVATHKVLARILVEKVDKYKNCCVSMIQLAIEQNKKKFEKDICNALRNYNGIFKDKLKVYEVHNLVPNVLRYELATLISGTTVTPTFKANYMAVGDDATAPTNSDTQLGNETLRGGFTNRYAIENVAYLDKFFSSAEVGGTSIQEAGIFVDGSATPGSGYLLSHTLHSESMAVSETLTVNSTVSIS
ncbi:MAG: hypothetical protein V3U02_04480 [Calditrichia bacterium]